MSRWLIALRLARRDALRNRARTLLILVMVALPVTCAVAADTLLRADESVPETAASQSPLNELGAADARVIDELGTNRFAIRQDPVRPDYYPLDQSGSSVPPPRLPAPTPAAILAALPPGSRLSEVSRGVAVINVGSERFQPYAMTLDTRDSLVSHVVRVKQGRPPANADEIAVSPRLEAQGITIGSSAVARGGRPLRVVGIVTKPGVPWEADLVAMPGTIHLEELPPNVPRISLPPREWYIESPQPVLWESVLQLNDMGLRGVSRAVLADPPATEPPFDGGGGRTRWSVAVVGLVSAMTILQIVLLAGPAFAVGARRQQRALAQLAAIGGEPCDARRVVLASALVIGGLSAIVGAVLGLAAAGVIPILLRPFDVGQGRYTWSPAVVALIALAAVASAMTAALLPARTVARQDPVAVLTNRRSAPRTTRTYFPAAILMLAIGAHALYDTAIDRDGDEVSVAFAGVPAVIGAVLLAPTAVKLLGRTAAALPLPLRFAARDASRNPARTAPAVASVIAVVAAAVALGTGAASDAAEPRERYQPTAKEGTAVISTALRDQSSLPGIIGAIKKIAPGRAIKHVQGTSSGPDTGVSLCASEDAHKPICEPLSAGYTQELGTPLLVGDAGLEIAAALGTEQELVAARSALSSGGIAVFTNRPLTEPSLVLRRERYGAEGPQVTSQVRLEATGIVVPGIAPALAVLPEAVARQLGLEVVTTALVVDGPFGKKDGRRLNDAVTVRAPEAQATVIERIPADSSNSLLPLLVLGSVATVLVLAGTMTATQLALSDARPDFAALHGVGAAPWTRRRISAAYAGLIALVGALLGAATGLIPGIAVAYPLTRHSPSGTTVALPWALLALLIVGVPAIAALAAAATTRAELPGYSRGVGA